MSSTNPTYIRKVALIGASGNVGSHFLTALLATNKHSITVLTRPSSTATFPPEVTVTNVDYESAASIVSALRGHDVLIITLSALVSPDLHPRIVQAAADAGVTWVVPNYYAYALSERLEGLVVDPILSFAAKYLDDVRNAGVKWVAMCCGFWYEFSLGMGEPWLGFDIKGRKVTIYDDGQRRINTSTWKLCGEALAKLFSLPVEKNGKHGPALSDWEDRGLYISSFLISQREVLDSLHRVLGTSDSDWDIVYQPAAERYQEGMKELAEGKRTGFAKAMYAKIFEEGEKWDYETGYGLDNEKLGIRREELDEATKRAVEMVEGGFGWKG